MSPRANRGIMTSLRSCARAAVYSEASAHAAMSWCSTLRRISRTFSPRTVPPGSRTLVTGRLSRFRDSTSRAAWVVLPDPSTPSKVTSRPRIQRESYPQAPARIASTMRWGLLDLIDAFESASHLLGAVGAEHLDGGAMGLRLLDRRVLAPVVVLQRQDQVGILGVVEDLDRQAKVADRLL